MTRRLLSAVLLLGIALQCLRAQAPDLATLARQAIETELRKAGQPVEQLRIEIPGGPVLAPEHTHLHRAANSPGRARLSGRVVSGMWDPVGNLQISVGPEADPRRQTPATTSAAGEFEFPDLSPGTYRISFGSDISRQLTLSEGSHRILVTEDLQPHFLFSPVKPPKPRAFVETYQENRLVRYDAVEFEDSEARIELTVDQSTAGDSDDPFGKPVLLSDGEWRQLRAEVAPFLKALYDVASGPERLRPFLSPRIRCRIYYSGERKLPAIDDQRCALNLLDSGGLAAWIRLEVPVENSGRLFFDWFNPPPGLADEEVIGVARRSHDVFRNELRDAGLLSGEHGDLILKYLMAWTPPVVKVVVEKPDPAVPLPRGTFYMLSSPFPIFFAREGTDLRIVCVLIAGG